MKVFTRDQMYKQALRLIDALIQSGPENEDELHLLQALLDPDPELDDFEELMHESEQAIEQAEESLLEMLSNLDD